MKAGAVYTIFPRTSILILHFFAFFAIFSHFALINSWQDRLQRGTNAGKMEAYEEQRIHHGDGAGGLRRKRSRAGSVQREEV